MKPDPPLLKLVIRGRIAPKPDEPREIVEVVKDGEVIGQLPITRVRFDMRPNQPGIISFDLYGWKADLETHD